MLPEDRYIYLHQLSPYALRLQVFEYDLGLRWYGLAYAFSFLLVYLFLRAALRRGEVRGLSEPALERLLFALVLGVLLGGRIGYVLQHPRELLSDPAFVFRVWEGGMAFFGGLAGVILAVGWMARRYGLSVFEITDVGVFPASLGLGLGRIANFINGELVGIPTGEKWGVIFPNVDALPRHPSQLYEAASHFLMFVILAWAARRRSSNVGKTRAGRLSALFLFLYGAFRFLTDYYRQDDLYFGPFSTGQWASLLVSLVGLLLLGYLSRKKGSVPPA